MIIGICRNCKGTGNLWYGTGMCVGCSFEALDRENRNLKETLTEALNDDNYGDHSSGIWQIKAKKALGVYYMICPECEEWHNQYTHGCECNCHNNGEEKK